MLFNRHSLIVVMCLSAYSFLASCGSSTPTALTTDLGSSDGATATRPTEKPTDSSDQEDQITTHGTFSIGTNASKTETLSASDGNNQFRPGRFFDAWNVNLGTLAPGDRVQVDMSSTQFDTFLQLIDRDTMTVIAENDDFEGTNSRLTFSIQAGRRYQIRTTSYSSSATGTYNLRTRQLALPPGFRPNDTRYAEQWGYENIGMPTVWDRPSSSLNQVIVSVLDTGIFSAHPDAPAATGNNARILGSGSNVLRGQNAAETPQNASHHGTHVAGTIAAKSNNGTGVAGVLWGGRSTLPVILQSVRVLGDNGSGTWFDVVQGIYYAAGLQTSVGIRNTRPAKVINMSLGGSGFCTSTLEAAIRAATQAGSSVIVSGGNTGSTSPLQPASCPSVTLTVGATDINNSLASFSSFGFNDISAPGVNVLSTFRNPDYSNLNGTSMASPHVAGAAAYLLARNPNLSPSQIRGLLMANAQSFNDPRMGVGILRVPGALNAAGTQQGFVKSIDMATSLEVATTKRVALRGEIESQAEFVPGEIIVTYASPTKSLSQLQEMGLTSVVLSNEADLPSLVKLSGAQLNDLRGEAALKQKTLETIQMLLKSPDVIDAHPNYILRANY